MSQKTAVIFCVWTAVWCAIFYYIYEIFLGQFQVPWVMFVCMTIFFAIKMQPRQLGAAIICYFAGLAWGQFDYLFINIFHNAGLNIGTSSFIALVMGTLFSMYIHMKIFEESPLQHISFVFAGVCSTFAEGGSNVFGLAVTAVWGLILAVVCVAALMFCSKRWPYEPPANPKKPWLKKKYGVPESPREEENEESLEDVEFIVNTGYRWNIKFRSDIKNRGSIKKRGTIKNRGNIKNDETIKNIEEMGEA